MLQAGLAADTLIARSGEHTWIRVAAAAGERLAGRVVLTQIVPGPTRQEFALTSPFVVRPFVVPKGSAVRLEVPFEVPIGALAVSVSVELEGVDGVDRVFRVRSSFEPALRVAVLGVEPMGWPEVRRGFDPSDSSPDAEALEVVLAMTAATDLPHVARALDPLRVIVWRRPRPERLDHGQRQALLQWVEMGGTLVVILSDGHRAWSASELGRLLPIEGRGVIASASATTALAYLAPGRRAAEPDAPQTPMLQLERACDGCETRVACADGPLIITRRQGHGLGVGLLFDPVAPELQGRLDRAGLWRRLLISDRDPLEELSTLGPLPPRRPVGEPRHRGIVLPLRVGWFDAGEPIPRNLVLAVALLYLLLVGPLDFVVVRKLGRPTLVWVTGPVVAVLMTVAVVGWIGGRRSLESTLRCVEVLRPEPGAADVRVEAVCGLWTAGPEDLLLRSVRGGGVVDRVLGARAEMQRITHGRGQEVQLSTLALSEVRFTAWWLEEAPGPLVSIDDPNPVGFVGLEASRRGW
jgi:hypothetical protein